MERVLFFTDDDGPVPAHMLASLAAAMRGRDFELVGVATRNPVLAEPGRRRRLVRGLRRALLERLSPELRPDLPLPPPLDAAALGLPLLVAPEADCNRPEFIERIAKQVRPTIGFSCYSLQRWSPTLIGVFEQAVNYHNGELPRRRGWGASAWAILDGDTQSGFSLHRMTPEIDAGPVLVEGRVPLRPGMRTDALEWNKVAAAAARLPDLLDRLESRAPGRDQAVGPEPPRPRTRRDAERSRRIRDPERLTQAELERRLQAWRLLMLDLDGRRLPVTRLASARPGQAGAFRTRDGRVLRPTRFDHLPRPLWALRRRLRRFRLS